MAEADMFQQEIEVARLEADVTQARARLNTLMSLMPSQYDWEFAPAELGIQVPLVEPLDAIPHAYDQRFDLQIRKMQVLAAAFQVDLEKARIFDMVSLGFAYEQAQAQEVGVRREGTDYEKIEIERAHERSYGLAASIELPVFDQNQAQIAKAKYRLRQAKKLMKVMKAQIREDMFDDMARIRFHLKHARTYRNKIEPRMVQAMAYSNRYFDAMRMNVFFYLRSVDRLIRSHLAYLQALRGLRLAIIDLELHLGGQIPQEWYGDELVTYGTPALDALRPGAEPPEWAASPPQGAQMHDIQGYTFPIVLRDAAVDVPSELRAGIIAFRITNAGSSPRLVRFVGPDTDETLASPLEPGEMRVLKIRMRPGTYDVAVPATADEPEVRRRLTVLSRPQATNPQYKDPTSNPGQE